MNGNGPLRCFVKEWTCYLQQHGHRVRELAECPSVLISRNRKGRRYRWFLCVVEGKYLWLPERNVRTVRTHVRLARRSREQCFVVVKFGHPPGVALVVPACPTMADVRNHLQAYKAKGREAGWMESAMWAVEVLCFGEMGEVLNSPGPLDIAGLLDRRVSLELDALTNADKTFLIESLLLWIHHYRLAQQQREDFKHAILIEEAHHILLRKKQEATGEETVTDVLLREIRELGEAIICLDQHPSLISKPALGNTYTTFAFNLKHRGDISMMQDCLHLDGEQAGYLGRLEVGWAMVKLQGRWFLPFLIKLPLVSLNKGSTTDEDIRRRYTRTGREGDSGVISRQEGGSAPAETKDNVVRGIPAEGKGEEESGKAGCAIRLTTQDRLFLADVWQHPTSAVTDHYSSLGVTPRGGTGVQKSLQAKGLIISCPISTGRARIKILSLTDLGKRVLGVDEPDSDRLGGPEHRYWKKRLAEHLRASGYEVVEEYPVGGGKAIDLVASRDGRRIAFEVETGKSDAAANVEKCLKAGIGQVIVVAVSAQARDAIAKTPAPLPEAILVDGHEVLRRPGCAAAEGCREGRIAGAVPRTEGSTRTEY